MIKDFTGNLTPAYIIIGWLVDLTGYNMIQNFLFSIFDLKILYNQGFNIAQK